jgi:hypothetical protein
MKYYIGFDWNANRRKTNKYPYCFLSVAVNYSYHQYKKLSGWTINNAKDIMLDSGGFSFLNRFGDYPFGVDTFVDWYQMMMDANNKKISFISTPDYPCEEEITRTCKLKTNYERIIATVDKAVECYDKHPDVPWMPVIQGYEPSEYEMCLSLYRCKGIKPKKFAVGSMCRRTNIKKIEYHIKNLIEYGLKEEIHIFGLCIRGMKSKYLFDNVDSCDSVAYTYNCKTYGDTKKKFDEMMDVIGGYVIRNREQITLMDLIDLNY